MDQIRRHETGYLIVLKTAANFLQFSDSPQPLYISSFYKPQKKTISMIYPHRNRLFIPSILITEDVLSILLHSIWTDKLVQYQMLSYIQPYLLLSF